MARPREREHEQAVATPALRPDDLVGDADRRRHADLLERAYADGLLEVPELEGMLERVLRVRTAGELQAVTAILPVSWLAAVQRADAAAARSSARRSAVRREVQAYLAVLTLLVGIWVLTALTAGPHFFWPIWPALGWGLPLLGRLRHVQEDRPHRSRFGGPPAGWGGAGPASLRLGSSVQRVP